MLDITLALLGQDALSTQPARLRWLAMNSVIGLAGRILPVLHGTRAITEGVFQRDGRRYEAMASDRVTSS